MAPFAWPPLRCCSQRCRALHRSKESLHQVALTRFAKTALSPACLGQVVSCDALTSCLAPPACPAGRHIHVAALLAPCCTSACPARPTCNNTFTFAVRLHLPRPSAGQPCTASTHLHVCTPAARLRPPQLHHGSAAAPASPLHSATESSSPLPALWLRLRALNHNSLHFSIV